MARRHAFDFCTDGISLADMLGQSADPSAPRLTVSARRVSDNPPLHSIPMSDHRGRRYFTEEPRWPDLPDHY